MNENSRCSERKTWPNQNNNNHTQHQKALHAIIAVELTQPTNNWHQLHWHTVEFSRITHHRKHLKQRTLNPVPQTRTDSVLFASLSATFRTLPAPFTPVKSAFPPNSREFHFHFLASPIGFALSEMWGRTNAAGDAVRPRFGRARRASRRPRSASPHSPGNSENNTEFCERCQVRTHLLSQARSNLAPA